MKLTENDIQKIRESLASELQDAGYLLGELSPLPGDALSGADPATTPLAGLIDHTLLKPESTPNQVEKLCDEARQHHFASVCINPGYVAEAAAHLAGTDVAICTVIGFPLGATTTTAKVMETRDALSNGATELDMVLPVGRLRAADNLAVFEDIRAIATAAGPWPLKVILETTLLTDEEKIRACLISKAAGADFVKTSTGFAGGGATPEDIALMRWIVGPGFGVKASGGIRNTETARAMILAGANRLGCSASIAIINGDPETGGDSY